MQCADHDARCPSVRLSTVLCCGQFPQRWHQYDQLWHGATVAQAVLPGQLAYGGEGSCHPDSTWHYRVTNRHCHGLSVDFYQYVCLRFFPSLSSVQEMLRGAWFYEHVYQRRHCSHLSAFEQNGTVQYLLGLHYTFPVWRILQCHHLHKQLPRNTG